MNPAHIKIIATCTLIGNVMLCPNGDGTLDVCSWTGGAFKCTPAPSTPAPSEPNHPEPIDVLRGYRYE